MRENILLSLQQYILVVYCYFCFQTRTIFLHTLKIRKIYLGCLESLGKPASCSCNLLFVHYLARDSILFLLNYLTSLSKKHIYKNKIYLGCLESLGKPASCSCNLLFVQYLARDSILFLLNYLTSLSKKHIYNNKIYLGCLESLGKPASCSCNLL